MPGIPASGIWKSAFPFLQFTSLKIEYPIKQATWRCSLDLWELGMVLYVTMFCHQTENSDLLTFGTKAMLVLCHWAMNELWMNEASWPQPQSPHGLSKKPFFFSHRRDKPRRHTELRWGGVIPDNSSSHFTLKLLSGGVTASLLGWGTPLMSSFASRQSAWRLKPQQSCTSENTYSTFPPSVTWFNKPKNKAKSSTSSGGHFQCMCGSSLAVNVASPHREDKSAVKTSSRLPK